MFSVFDVDKGSLPYDKAAGRPFQGALLVVLPFGNDFSVDQFFGIAEFGYGDNDLITDMEILIILIR